MQYSSKLRLSFSCPILPLFSPKIKLRSVLNTLKFPVAPLFKWIDQLNDSWETADIKKSDIMLDKYFLFSQAHTRQAHMKLVHIKQVHTRQVLTRQDQHIIQDHTRLALLSQVPTRLDHIRQPHRLVLTRLVLIRQAHIKQVNWFFVVEIILLIYTDNKPLIHRYCN